MNFVHPANQLYACLDFQHAERPAMHLLSAVLVAALAAGAAAQAEPGCKLNNLRKAVDGVLCPHFPHHVNNSESHAPDPYLAFAGDNVFDGAEYWYSQNNGADIMSFDDAQAVCEGMNSNLASVHSKAENNYIFNLNPQISKLRWIGAIRNRSAEPVNPTPSQFVFRFIDGTPYDVLDDPEFADCNPSFLDSRCLFQTGEPNDLSPGEDCIVQGSRDSNALVLPGQWNDAACGFQRQFVCKRPSEYSWGDTHGETLG